MSSRTTGPTLVILFLLFVAIVAWRGVLEIEQETRASVGQALQTVLQTTEQAIYLWVQTRTKDAQAMARQPKVIELTKALLDLYRTGAPPKSSAPLRQLRRQLNPTIQHSGYLGFFILAPDNTNLASMREGNIGTVNFIASKNAELLSRVHAGESLVVPTMFSDEPLQGPTLGGARHPTMFVATPIRSSAGEIIAALAIRLDPINDFSSLTRLGRIGNSGETYAFNRDGMMISVSRFESQLRSIGLIRLGERSVLNIRISDPVVDLTAGSAGPPEDQRQLTHMAKSAVAGRRGINTEGYRDYRGVSVLGAWLWSQQLDFGLTTEIDEKEALQPYYFTRNVVLGSVGVTATLSILLALYLMIVRSKAVQQMETAQTVLEERVRERTNELLTINEKLQENVIERVRAEEQLKVTHAELEETNIKLAELASEDGLTGIANRRAFDQHLQAEWDRRRRDQEALSLILFDIDYFKNYNDTYGHQAGDECLASIGNALQTGDIARRPGDLIARYGGEEFVVVLGKTDTGDASDIGEKLCSRISNLRIPHRTSKVGHVKFVTVSVGIATMRPSGQTVPADIIAAADKALYQAKRTGRNKCAVAQPLAAANS